MEPHGAVMKVGGEKNDHLREQWTRRKWHEKMTTGWE